MNLDLAVASLAVVVIGQAVGIGALWGALSTRTSRAEKDIEDERDERKADIAQAKMDLTNIGTLADKPMDQRVTALELGMRELRDDLRDDLAKAVETIQGLVGGFASQLAKLAEKVSRIDKDKASRDDMKAAREPRDPTPPHGVPVWRPDPRRDE